MACATCPHTQMAAEIQSSYSSWNPFQSSPQKKVQISSSRWFLLQTHLNSSAVSSDLNSHDNYVRLPKQRTGQRPEEIYQLHVLNMSSHLNVLLWMTSQVYHKLLHLTTETQKSSSAFFFTEDDKRSFCNWKVCAAIADLVYQSPSRARTHKVRMKNRANFLEYFSDNAKSEKLNDAWKSQSQTKRFSKRLQSSSEFDIILNAFLMGRPGKLSIPIAHAWTTDRNWNLLLATLASLALFQYRFPFGSSNETVWLCWIRSSISSMALRSQV